MRDFSKKKTFSGSGEKMLCFKYCKSQMNVKPVNVVGCFKNELLWSRDYHLQEKLFTGAEWAYVMMTVNGETSYNEDDHVTDA